MNNTKLCYFFIFLIISLNGFTQKLGKYPIQNFSPKNYHSGNQNNAFAQNGNTRLFVANNLGVLSFNGNSWESYPIQIGSKTRSLAFDKTTNRLYVGAQGDLGYFHKDWEYVSLRSLLPEEVDFDEVWNVYLYQDRVYFCTFQAIFIYENNEIKVIQHDEGFFRSFLVNGVMYVQLNEGDLYQLKEDYSLEKVISIEDEMLISSILPYEKGLLIIYNSGYIEWYGHGEREAKFTQLASSIENKYVNQAIYIMNDKIGIATQLDGVYLYDLQSKEIEHISKSMGLLSNACLHLFLDFQGNLWIGMQNGISLVNINSPMRILGEEIGIEGSGYQSLETANEIYLSTSNGIYRYDKELKTTHLLAGTEGPSYEIVQIYDKIYACHHKGLFLLKGNDAKQIFFSTGIWNLQLIQNGRAALAGSYNGLYLVYPNEEKELQEFKKVNGFNESSRFVVEDSQNRIWVSQYYKGVYKIDLPTKNTETKIERVGTEMGLPTNTSNSISVINNQMHFATPQGIYVYNERDKKIEKSPIFYSPIGNHQIDLIKEDNKGNVLVVTEDRIGIFFKNGPGNYTYQTSSLYELQYSINNDLLEASNGLNEGLLLSANEGFIYYQPELEIFETNQPPLFIQKLRSIRDDSILFEQLPFERTSNQQQKFIFPYHSNSIQIQVESFDFYSEDRFRYKLNGLDEQFTEWTTNAVKEYTNIQPGTYQFIAESQNSYGEIHASIPITIRVKPPWYLSNLAKFIYLVLSIILIYYLYRWQRHLFRQKAKQIVKVKQQEIHLEQEKLREVEKRSAEEIGQLKEEKMESELRHLNNLLAASTMNLVVKNEFIETIQEELKTIKKRNASEATKQSIHKIVKDIDSNLRLQEDWERFEHHFDKVHGDFLDRIREKFPDLTPQDQKLCAYLRLNLNTKEIAQLMSISNRGVEMARYRLRKRLNMETEQNLSKFILEY